VSARAIAFSRHVRGVGPVSIQHWPSVEGEHRHAPRCNGLGGESDQPDSAMMHATHVHWVPFEASGLKSLPPVRRVVALSRLDDDGPSWPDGAWRIVLFFAKEQLVPAM